LTCELDGLTYFGTLIRVLQGRVVLINNGMW